MNESAAQKPVSTEGAVRIIYILYLAGLVIGVTEIIGVVMAYINKDDAPE